MRFNSERALGEPAVASIAEGFLLMATVTLLLVILSLDRVNAHEVTAVAFRFVVTTEITLRKIVAGTTTLVTVQAPFLLMALVAVFAGLAG
jgi:hypothetical protein